MQIRYRGQDHGPRAEHNVAKWGLWKAERSQRIQTESEVRISASKDRYKETSHHLPVLRPSFCILGTVPLQLLIALDL